VQNPGTATDLYYSSTWQVLEERTGDVSTATIQYVWSPLYVDALVLRDRSTQNNGTLDERLWLQQDANFNVTALLNGSGTVVERYIDDPYGKPTYLSAAWATIGSSAYAWVYLLQGGRYDALDGQYDFRNRVLSQSLSRWLQQDPLRQQSQDDNFYRLEGNHPLSTQDALGLVEGPYGSSSTNLSTIRLVFDPAKSQKAVCCSKITFVQVSQVVANGRPILPSDYSAQWKYSDVYTTRPDYYQVDQQQGSSSPIYLHEDIDTEGTVWGKSGMKVDEYSQNAVLLDDPAALGGDKGFLPKAGGWRTIELKFETFAFCDGGRERGKWYEGVKWEYFQSSQRALRGMKGVSSITDWNLETPSESFLRAYNLFIAWGLSGRHGIVL
jgi:RHS repeat-associated protein